MHARTRTHTHTHSYINGNMHTYMRASLSLSPPSLSPPSLSLPPLSLPLSLSLSCVSRTLLKDAQQNANVKIFGVCIVSANPKNCSHETSLNLYSNLQVLLVILILKSRFYSRKCACGVFLKVAFVAEAILRKSALSFHYALSSFCFNP